MRAQAGYLNPDSLDLIERNFVVSYPKHVLCSTPRRHPHCVMDQNLSCRTLRASCTPRIKQGINAQTHTLDPRSALRTLRFVCVNFRGPRPARGMFTQKIACGRKICRSVFSGAWIEVDPMVAFTRGNLSSRVLTVPSWSCAALSRAQTRQSFHCNLVCSLQGLHLFSGCSVART
jgi:hypothetical protein